MEEIKGLFFNEALKRWHFEEIVRASKMSRERVNHFLKRLLKEEYIKRVKPKGSMPFYIADRDSIKFQSEKRLYGLALLEKAGLFKCINSIKGIKTAILFGSFARGDWGKSSDIDIFIYGNDKDFNRGEFETKTKREMQLFSYQTPDKIKRELDPKLIPNIVKGFNIKGSLEPFEVSIHA